MRPFIVVGYYTVNTAYEKEVPAWSESLNKFGLPFKLYPVTSAGSWVGNCAQKPTIILQALLDHPDMNIVYLDIDGRVQRPPVFFDECNCDISYYRDKEVINSTIYFKNCSKVHRFVERWIELQSQFPEVWDQRTMEMCLSDVKLAELPLPVQYLHIFDRKVTAPVITHFQASRRYKQLYYDRYPESVDGQKPRVMIDGSFHVPRVKKDTAKRLDTEYNRVPNENRWFPKSKNTLDINVIRPYFDGQGCYLVGKGPSLDHLHPSVFHNSTWPIIAINESIHRVESLNLPNPTFLMQQDNCLFDSCKPKRAIALLTNEVQYFYPNIPKYVFRWQDLGIRSRNITAVYAIAFAKKLGTNRFVLLAFDSCTMQNYGYAGCIKRPVTAGGDPARFASHRRTIERALGNVPVAWVTPGVPV
jgi:hypothetical protein